MFCSKCLTCVREKKKEKRAAGRWRGAEGPSAGEVGESPGPRGWRAMACGSGREVLRPRSLVVTHGVSSPTRVGFALGLGPVGFTQAMLSPREWGCWSPPRGVPESTGWNSEEGISVSFLLWRLEGLSVRAVWVFGVPAAWQRISSPHPWRGKRMGDHGARSPLKCAGLVSFHVHVTHPVLNAVCL